MPVYDKPYFIERFKNAESEDLAGRLWRGELSDEAAEAIREILRGRGVDEHRFEFLIANVRRDVVRSSGVTNHCDFCRKSTLAPLHNEGQKFCSSDCLRQARLLERAILLAPDLVAEHAESMRRRPCPRCKSRLSMLEMRPAFHIVSAFFICSRHADHEFLCRRCGIRRNVFASIVDFFLGWWSLPGLFVTPIFIYRNIREAYRDRFDAKPSRQLVYRAMLELAESLPPIEKRLDDVSRQNAMT